MVNISLNVLNINHFMSLYLKKNSDCLPAYSGTQCEILSCENEPAICLTAFDSTSCDNPIIKSFCPTLCGSCGPSTTKSSINCASAVDDALCGDIFGKEYCPISLDIQALCPKMCFC